MLVAHLVPGYFAAAKSQPQWSPKWSTNQRILLWVTALGSTVAPDLDVIYNALFRGFINHSVLWTHSLFVYLGIGLIWWLLNHVHRWSYLRTLIGLVVIGGLSHLVLDVISHGTPLLYPLSMMMFGAAPEHVVEIGFWAYVTDPIFLLEPLLLTLAAMHWSISQKSKSTRFRKLAVVVLLSGLVLFSGVFLLSLPILQSAVANL